MIPFDNILGLMVNLSTVIVTYGVNLVIHSSIILAAGLIVYSVMRAKQASFQSFLLRSCLIAVLLSPFVSIHLDLPGVAGLHLPKAAITNSIDSPSLYLKTDASSSHKSAKHVKCVSALTNNTGIQPAQPNHLRNSLPAEPAKIIQYTASSGTVKKSKFLLAGKTADYLSGIFERYLCFIYIAFIVVWGVLSLCVLMKTGMSYYTVRKIRRSAVRADETLIKTCGKAARRLGIKAPEVYQSELVNTAYLGGLRYPAIYMPMNADRDSIGGEDVFIHELAHLIRHDNVWNYLCVLGGIILPFQPLLWILIHRITLTSDYACDDYVVTFRKKPHDYAIRIYAIATLYKDAVPRVVSGAGIVSGRSFLPQRITRILDTKVPRGVKPGLNDILSTMFLFSCALVITGFTGFRTDHIGKRNVDIYKGTPQVFHAQAVSRDLAADNNPDGTVSKSIIRGSAYNPPRHEPGPAVIAADKVDIALSSLDDSSVSHAFPLFDNSISHKKRGDSGWMRDESRFSDVRYRGDTIKIDENGLYTSDKKEYEYSLDLAGIDSMPDMTWNSMLSGEMPVSSLSADKHTENSPVALDVEIPYDFTNGEPSDNVQKKLEILYRSLQRNKLYPVWSPDGKWIAFTDKFYGIWVVPAEGGEPTLIYDSTQKFDFVDLDETNRELRTIGFTPDGSSVTIAEKDSDARGVSLHDESNSMYTIFSVNIYSGKTSVVVKNAVKGYWSPDGDRFAYIRQQEENITTLGWIDIVSGKTREYNNIFSSSVCYSGDGSHLYFTMPDDNNISNIFTMPGMGGEIEQITFTGAQEVFDRSGDGRLLLYSDTGKGTGLKLMDIVTGEIRDVVPDNNTHVLNAKFSPDGGSICFNMSEQYDEGIKSEVYIYRFDFEPETSVNSGSNDQPGDFSLLDCYPNPFNLSTTISFSIHKTGGVTLEIYSVTGQKVRELVSGTLGAGEHSIVWDGRDDNGFTVSSGTYISLLRMDGHRASRKMTLMK